MKGKKKKLTRYQKAQKAEALKAKIMAEENNTEESEESDDNEYEKKKDIAIKHHASCMSSAAMENAYNICHNVQVITLYAVFASKPVVWLH